MGLMYPVSIDAILFAISLYGGIVAVWTSIAGSSSPDTGVAEIEVAPLDPH